tara:strand:+ start:250 stop:456 length:207 start_codon:yes stop_codon:yes gene_type:complete
VLSKILVKKGSYKILDYEKFLLEYVSIPTARKMIKELIEFNINRVNKSDNDLRVNFLEIIDSDRDKYL